MDKTQSYEISISKYLLDTYLHIKRVNLVLRILENFDGRTLNGNIMKSYLIITDRCRRGKFSLNSEYYQSMRECGWEWFLFGADISDGGHLGQRLPDVSIDDQGDSDDECDDGYDENGDDVILDVLGHTRIIYLLRSDSVDCPDNNQVLCQNEPARV